MTTALEATDNIAAKNAAHPRVSLADIEAAIAAENYLNVGDAVCRCGQDDTAPMHLMTLCILTMNNGFVVTGESAPASPENYDKAKGRVLARENAFRKLWPLMGFSLRDRLQHGVAAD